MPAPRKPRESDPSSTPDEAAASSTASSAADQPPVVEGPAGFFSAPGPGFDEDQAAREPEPQPEQAILDVAWEEETVRSVLNAQGVVLHSLAGKGEEDWLYTREELRAISGPLTRILNRYPITQAAAGTGDELAVLIGLGGYVTRSVKERRAVLAAAAAADEPEERIAGPVFPGGPGAPAGADDVVDFPPIS